MALDRQRARAALRTHVAGPLGLTVADAALGIVRIADANMSLAVRAVSVERGCDPRDCAMVAFGGAGPLHAVALAREIFIPRVVIPKFPGAFSALGMLFASWRQDFVQTFVAPLDEVDEGAAGGALAELAAAGRAQLAREALGEAEAVFAFAADLRYRGQEHTIPVPVAAAADLTGGGSGVLRAGFDALHERRYGHAARDEPLEVVNLRLTLTVPRDDGAAGEWLSAPVEPDEPRPEERREVVFDDPEAPLEARIVWRPALAAGYTVEGPAVIEERNSTTLVHPGDVARIAEAGHIVIDVAQAEGAGAEVRG
jgi:N-methylhydantoinase A